MTFTAIMAASSPVSGTAAEKSPSPSQGSPPYPARPETTDVETELARVMRSRILNPKWLEGLKRHGYKGAQELSTTFDTFFGWDAAAEVSSNWMYDAMARQFRSGSQRDAAVDGAGQ